MGFFDVEKYDFKPHVKCLQTSSIHSISTSFQTSAWLNWMSWFDNTAIVIRETLSSVTLDCSPLTTTSGKRPRHYKRHHSSSARVSGWKRRDGYIIDMTDSCGVGHWAVSAVDRELHSQRQHTPRAHVMELNTVDNINKVRGASLFPCGQFLCNELQVVRLLGGRRWYRVRASGEMLMQPEGGVSHIQPLSIGAGIIRCTAAAWLNHSHYRDSWHWGWNKGSIIRVFLIAQWVSGCLRISSQAVSTGGEGGGWGDSSTTHAWNSSPLGHSHTQSVLNFHFTLGNQLLVSRAIEEKTYLSWE